MEGIVGAVIGGLIAIGAVWLKGRQDDKRAEEQRVHESQERRRADLRDLYGRFMQALTVNVMKEYKPISDEQVAALHIACQEIILMAPDATAEAAIELSENIHAGITNFHECIDRFRKLARKDLGGGIGG